MPPRPDWRNVRDALQLHFIESPYIVRGASVTIEAKGFTIVAHRLPTGFIHVETWGTPTDDQIERLGKADELLRGSITRAMSDQRLAERVRATGAKHSFRPKFETHHLTYKEPTDSGLSGE